MLNFRVYAPLELNKALTFITFYFCHELGIRFIVEELTIRDLEVEKILSKRTLFPIDME